MTYHGRPCRQCRHRNHIKFTSNQRQGPLNYVKFTSNLCRITSKSRRIDLEITSNRRRNHPGAFFWARKKTLREWGHANPNICWDRCDKRVSSWPKQQFGCGKSLGRVFGGIKSPCGNGDTHSLGCPNKIDVFSYGKTLGRVFGGTKSPCGNGDTHSLVLGKYWSRTPVPPGCVVRVPAHWAI